MAAARIHIVRPGECLASLASRYGVGGAQKLYDHPANAELRSRRPSPHILAPGDVVHIPPTDEQRTMIQSGAANRYRGRVPRVPLRVRLSNPDGQAIADTRYELVVSGQKFTGNTNAEGLVEHDIDATATEASLRLLGTDGVTVERTVMLAIGHLDPIDTPSGVRARLKNLGLLRHGNEREAIRVLQRQGGLTDTGEIDDRTRQVLLEQYGC